MREDGAPDEPHEVPAQEAAGHHQWRGQPHEVLVRGDVNPMCLFQGQNQIKGKFNLTMYMCQFP